ncbi:hypothetical protein [Microvirga puerhi]|uniref:Uncharacterized protein n=1 Tax=Microvirga puerhi TaxID=2876078 RepID=A0ABS7VS03_9HYPH|nr:hypothetical protein [Microvirga puerhi]MBZ6078343.1 hypothetical protein [Microvirga puerhi]
MKRFVWLIALILVSFWSLLAWGAYGLIDLFGSTAARHADVVSSHPGTVEWLSWSLGALRNLGLAAIVFVWAVVAVFILAVPTTVSFILGKAFRPVEPMGWGGEEYPRPGYRDVTPHETATAPEEEPRRIERH